MSTPEVSHLTFQKSQWSFFYVATKQPTHAQAEHVIHEADVEGGSTTGHRIWRAFQNEEISRQGWLLSTAQFENMSLDTVS